MFAAAFVTYGARPLDAPGGLLVMPVPVLIALAVCWVSVSWAIAPDIAVRRLILTTVVVWTIFLGTNQLGAGPTQSLLRGFLVVALLVNFLAVFGWPEIGIHQIDDPDETSLVGDWRGIMMHKNFAGALSAVTALLFIFNARAVPKALRIAAVAAAAIFLWFSQSKTSAGMAVAAVAVGLMYLRYNARYRVLAISGLCALALAAAAYINVYNEPISKLITDPKAFTGRTVIWKALRNYSSDHPLLGAGFGSFWNIGPGSPIHQYATGWVVGIASGHNGFLDLLVQIGLPGLAIVVACVFVWPLVRLLASENVIGEAEALLISMLLFSIGHNMTESTVLDRDSIVEVFLMFTIALIWNVSAKPARRTRSVSAGDDVFAQISQGGSASAAPWRS